MLPCPRLKPSLFFVVAIALSGCATNAPLVPYAVRATQSERPLLQLLAEGTQAYQCTETTSGPEWKFKGPTAVLKTANGAQLGTHYAGPTWEFTDGSKVVGTAISSAPAADRKSIPRLMLAAKLHEGQGLFADVDAVQRLATHGGQPPSITCEKGELGKRIDVPYTATYVFLTEGPRAIGD
jgi:hypothetical protein